MAGTAINYSPTCTTARPQRVPVRCFTSKTSRLAQLNGGKETPPQYSSDEVRARAEELHASGKELYPRYSGSSRTTSIRSLIARVDAAESEAQPSQGDAAADVQVLGRISSIRTHSSKLAFIDIVEDQLKLQIVLSLSALESSGISKDDFKRQCNLIRRGDFISINGHPPYRASNGQVSIKGTSLPALQSPCLNRFPIEERGFSTNESSNTHFRDRHVEMLTDPSMIETIKTRAAIIKTLRSFFEEKSFAEVQTPILANQAGGATARPFSTAATEFSDGRQLSLRIAPELWLKRLIVGGMDRIFEIGPSFRNEGLDKTHNPEFSTCEFYAVGHDLPRLMKYTQDLLVQLAHAVEDLKFPLPQHTTALLQAIQGEFQVLDFLPALSSALNQPLPDLHSPTAQQDLLSIFQYHSLPIPSTPTLPRLLDKLSSIYLEPQSLNGGPPTWITNIPTCLSPLAKSHLSSSTSNESSTPPQEIAARAELFINGHEIVNCYEEENSPTAQRRKFLEQQFYANQDLSSTSSPSISDDEVMPLDESYLRALEWGLPPTGGWGCGIDRLVMLFTGRERIADVLSFGSLRHVSHREDGGGREREKEKGE
ncbi:hypothetical protein LTR84_011525 [Exophiala bonariae]|uniref:Aminoacyl-transfer RNA synthetases class-II family profile domain-containing protein n=1 Tax=Exophiala bonariae TaxID=1690606 RepID=A0AAV9NG79_9EURO|nr:hypothetical protein LTR84_011525 [Exophiala bonariae]